VVNWHVGGHIENVSDVAEALLAKASGSSAAEGMAMIPECPACCGDAFVLGVLGLDWFVAVPAERNFLLKRPIS